MRGGPSRATVAAAGFVLALALAASALAGSARREGRHHDGDAQISASGAMRIEDSRGERAILEAPALAPGARVVGKVAIRNRGEAGDLVLSRRHLVEGGGMGGASLGEALHLTIHDLTPGARKTVYSGPLATMPPLHLGLLPAQERRRYRFVARLPEPGFVDLALMGAHVRFDYRWRLIPPRP
ncbi:MAG: hypothetical protein ACTHN3_06390 [Solirubrobacterales bacterium]